MMCIRSLYVPASKCVCMCVPRSTEQSEHSLSSKTTSSYSLRSMSVIRDASLGNSFPRRRYWLHPAHPTPSKLKDMNRTLAKQVTPIRTRNAPFSPLVHLSPRLHLVRTCRLVASCGNPRPQRSEMWIWSYQTTLRADDRFHFRC